MATTPDRLRQRLSKSTRQVEEADSAYRAILAEERELQRRKVEAKTALDDARARQRQDVHDALQAGIPKADLARDYGLSTATVWKYGQPPDDDTPHSRRRRRPGHQT